MRPVVYVPELIGVGGRVQVLVVLDVVVNASKRNRGLADVPCAILFVENELLLDRAVFVADRFALLVQDRASATDFGECGVPQVVVL